MTTTREFVPLPGSGWRPSGEVTDLLGQPLAADREWFAVPPAEIGKVVAAWSTQRAGRAPLPAIVKWLIVLLSMVLAVCVAWRLASLVQEPRGRRDLFTMLAIALPLLTLFIVAKSMQWKYRTWFVGADGVATFVHSGDPTSAKPTVLPFAHAVALRSAQTRHYHNGIYTGTNYSYLWFGPDARTLLKLSGHYYGKKKAETRNTPYRFALGAQLMWNRHYFNRAVQELQQTGGVLFPVGKKDSVRVLPGALEMTFRGESMYITPEEIAKISLAGGHFTIHHKDATWLSRKGKFGFTYGQMSNAQVFLMMVERLVGYRFT